MQQGKHRAAEAEVAAVVHEIGCWAFDAAIVATGLGAGSNRLANMIRNALFYQPHNPPILGEEINIRELDGVES